MDQRTTSGSGTSSPTWEGLHEWLRNWKMLMVAQKRFRRLNAPELLAKVHAGVCYEDGIAVTRKEAAA